jgi:hypothetical protein
MGKEAALAEACRVGEGANRKSFQTADGSQIHGLLEDGLPGMGTLPGWEGKEVFDGGDGQEDSRTTFQIIERSFVLSMPKMIFHS